MKIYRYVALAFFTFLSVMNLQNACGKDDSSADKATTTSLIQPFCGIKWEDGLVDVIKKINGIKGIEQFQLNADAGFNLTNPADWRDVKDA